MNTTIQEGTKNHEGLLSSAEEIHGVKQGATLNDQVGIQHAFQGPAQLSGYGCVCFLALLYSATDLKPHFFPDRSNRPLDILSKEEKSPPRFLEIPKLSGTLCPLLNAFLFEEAGEVGALKSQEF